MRCFGRHLSAKAPVSATVYDFVVRCAFSAQPEVEEEETTYWRNVEPYFRALVKQDLGHLSSQVRR